MTLDELIGRLQDVRAHLPATGDTLVYIGGPSLSDIDHVAIVDAGSRVVITRRIP